MPKKTKKGEKGEKSDPDFDFYIGMDLMLFPTEIVEAGTTHDEKLSTYFELISAIPCAQFDKDDKELVSNNILYLKKESPDKVLQFTKPVTVKIRPHEKKLT
jgi:hypothetical protein